MNRFSIVAAGSLGFVAGTMGTAAIALANKDLRKSAIKKTNSLLSSMRIWSDKVIEKLGKPKTEETLIIKEDLQEEI